MFWVIQAQWVEVFLQQASRPTQTYGKKEEEEEEAKRKEKEEEEEEGKEDKTNCFVKQITI